MAPPSAPSAKPSGPPAAGASSKPAATPAAPPKPASAPAISKTQKPVAAASGPESLADFKAEIELMLMCGSPPWPESFLSKFRQWGFVSKEPHLVEDGLEIYTLKKPVDLFGYRVVNVQAYAPKEGAERFPGTQLNPQIGVILKAKEEDVLRTIQSRQYSHQEVVVTQPWYSNDKSPSATVICHGR